MNLLNYMYTCCYTKIIASYIFYPPPPTPISPHDDGCYAVSVLARDDNMYVVVYSLFAPVTVECGCFVQGPCFVV